MLLARGVFKVCAYYVSDRPALSILIKFRKLSPSLSEAINKGMNTNISHIHHPVSFVDCLGSAANMRMRHLNIPPRVGVHSTDEFDL